MVSALSAATASGLALGWGRTTDAVARRRVGAARCRPAPASKAWPSPGGNATSVRDERARDGRLWRRDSTPERGLLRCGDEETRVHRRARCHTAVGAALRIEALGVQDEGVGVPVFRSEAVLVLHVVCAQEDVAQILRSHRGGAICPTELAVALLGASGHGLRGLRAARAHGKAATGTMHASHAQGAAVPAPARADSLYHRETRIQASTANCMGPTTSR
eukprot:CAMPEP_0185190872 /NCGR_PEP_ID=MMETSP1140-20130426/13265_1 /TAXON_ID=298111 /ORGANISM="Pavlova sp., Strain CCMP459" /LENGTH=218 /DNA_ID=CAMNT_0027757549 /DNA_START=321 /DNA_END=974 /DNA_ORIENTATION=-